MFDFQFNPAARLAPYAGRMQFGPSTSYSPFGGVVGQSVSPAPALADQQVAQKSATAGQSVAVNRSTQVNNHIQKINIVIDPSVIREMAGGSPLEEMRIKNRLMSLFAGLHGNYSNDQQHDVVSGPDGSQTVNSRTKVNNNPQLVTITFRRMSDTPELQAANNVVSLSADSLNSAGLGPIQALQVMDQNALADNSSKSINNLRQRAEKNQDVQAKVDDDIFAESPEDLFENLVGIVNHILYGSADGPQEPPVQQAINQASGAQNNSLALNNGQQVHVARQNVTLYVGDFNESNSDVTHDFARGPAAEYFARRGSSLPTQRRASAFLAGVSA